MVQKPMLRAEVYARALRASQNVKGANDAIWGCITSSSSSANEVNLLGYYNKKIAIVLVSIYIRSAAR